MYTPAKVQRLDPKRPVYIIQQPPHAHTTVYCGCCDGKTFCILLSIFVALCVLSSIISALTVSGSPGLILLLVFMVLGLGAGGAYYYLAVYAKDDGNDGDDADEKGRRQRGASANGTRYDDQQQLPDSETMMDSSSSSSSRRVPSRAPSSRGDGRATTGREGQGGEEQEPLLHHDHDAGNLEQEQQHQGQMGARIAGSRMFRDAFEAISQYGRGRGC